MALDFSKLFQQGAQSLGQAATSAVQKAGLVNPTTVGIGQTAQNILGRVNQVPLPTASRLGSIVGSGQPVQGTAPKFSDITTPAAKASSLYFSPQIMFGKAIGYYTPMYPWKKSIARQSQEAYQKQTEGLSFQQQKGTQIAQQQIQRGTPVSDKLKAIIAQDTATLPSQPFTASQIAGSALGTALDFTSVGVASKGSKVIKGLKTVAGGATLGSGYGLSEGLMANAQGKELGKYIATGAAIGTTLALGALGAKGIADYYGAKRAFHKAIQVNDDAQKILTGLDDKVKPQIAQRSIADAIPQIEFHYGKTPEGQDAITHLASLQTKEFSSWADLQQEMLSGIQSKGIQDDIINHINTRKLMYNDPTFLATLGDKAGVDAAIIETGDRELTGKTPEEIKQIFSDLTTQTQRIEDSKELFSRSGIFDDVKKTVPEFVSETQDIQKMTPQDIEPVDVNVLKKQAVEMLKDEVKKNGKGDFTRSYTTQVSDELKSLEKLVDDPRSLYVKVSNPELQAKALEKIGSDEQSAIALIKNPKDNERALATTIADLLIPKLSDAGRQEEAIDLAVITAERLTKEGQSIQAASMFNKLSPEGVTIYAQRLLNQASTVRKPLKLTPKVQTEIQDMAKSIQLLPEGRGRYLQTQVLLKKIAEQVPPSMGQKVSEFQTLAMLINPKTAIRNIIGNVGLAAAETGTQIAATPLDIAVTGIRKYILGQDVQRTVGLPNPITQFKGAIRGGKEVIEEVGLGLRPGQAAAQFELPNVPAFRGKIGETLNKALNVELGLPDRMFFTAAYDDSLQTQIRLAGANTPTEEMKAIATMDGLYRTLQDDNYVSKTLQGLKRVLNANKSFGFGDVVIKFPRTPGTILKRGIEYSPVGFVETVFRLANDAKVGLPFNQRAFVLGTTRASVGTTTIATGAILAGLGIITGKRSLDKDVNAAREEQGLGSYKLNVDALKRFIVSGLNPDEAKIKEGDNIINYDWFQPAALPLSIGANIVANKGEKGEVVTLTSALASLDSILEGVNTLAEQPVLRGVQDMLKYGWLEGAKSALEGIPSSFIPSVLGQVKLLIDSTKRDTQGKSIIETAGLKAMNRIPGLSQRLPESKTIRGETATYQMPKVLGSEVLGKVFNAFVNPAIWTQYKEVPEIKFTLDIMERSGETKQLPRKVDRKVILNGESVELGPKSYQDYQTFVGRMTTKVFSDLIKDPSFVMLSDEDKAKEMSNIISDINTAAKMVLWDYRPSKNPGDRTMFYVSGGNQFIDYYAPNLAAKRAGQTQ